jgi:hypothetical protein
MRVRIALLVLAALAVSCTGSGPPSHSIAPASPASTQPGSVRFHAIGSPAPPDERCPTPSRAEGAYEVLIAPTAGKPGTRVTMAGNTPLFAKSGRYLGPSGKIGFWFNLPPGGWEHVYFGGAIPRTYHGVPVIHLGEANVAGECSYRASFRVPNVLEGVYVIVPIEHGRQGSAAFRSIEFRVT